MSITEYKISITKIENLTKDVKVIRFSHPTGFEFKAGQFVSIKFVKNNEVKWRSYSILNEPSQKETLNLCIKIIPGGFSSSILNNIKVGDTFTMRGPLGMFTFDETHKGEHIFISTGTGIVPFHSMIIEYVKKGKKIFLIAGFRKKENILFKEKFMKLSKENSNFKYVFTLSREEDYPNRGRVQKYIPEDIKDKVFYLCGQNEMILETEKLLLNKGVKKENIRKERFS